METLTPKQIDLIGRLLRKEFDKDDTTYSDASQLLLIAEKLNVPQLNDMKNDLTIENFKPY